MTEAPDFNPPKDDEEIEFDGSNDCPEWDEVREQLGNTREKNDERT